MRSKIVEYLFSLALLFLFAALEEMTPKVLGVGAPFLLAAVQYQAVRRQMPLAVAFAIAAGAAEDAVSSLPLFTSAVYFLAVAVLTRRMDIPRGAIFLSYPLYQIWLSVWVGDLYGSIFTRVPVALAVGALVMFAVWHFLAFAERRAAVGE